MGNTLNDKRGVVTRRISSDVYAVILDGMEYEMFFTFDELEMTSDPDMAWFHAPLEEK
jgi:hypothetical protein